MRLRSMIAVAVAALAVMGLASSAMAADGVVRDVTDNSIIPNNTELHLVGWALFLDPNGNGMECHVTAVAKITVANGTTGEITNFSVPDTTKCTGRGTFAGCTVKSVTPGTPYHLTVTPTDFDVTRPGGGMIEIVIGLAGFLCPTPAKLTLPSITMKPLKTKTGVTTGTLGNIKQTTAAAGEPIAGVELESGGQGHIDLPGVIEMGINFSGELELTSPHRCTWWLAAN